ncbi:hypothetical protein HELRODRAFT_106532 [Helobdella robusta]|uniref:Nucleoside phosphorylase domain-containing protein n=1 Tax=Helobdella robusta TaxID=6412 RepID=T1EE32_HELRO|nr:hypothetical protein HELRODRAFT_106532 [Helobdella robusta]ESO02215.1 hypothetical protein HELRODRAFT_106532 [Helobdella robusta]
MGDYDEEKRVKAPNKNLSSLDVDIFHHLGINSKCKHFNNIFSDIKFVCMGGSHKRMGYLAQYVADELKIDIPAGCALTNISHQTDRYVMFKAGPVLCVNHGIGVNSTMVVLHEVIKALHYSQASDVHVFRVGTSGGLGLEPGTVVLTSEALDGCLRNFLEVPILGEMVKKPSKLDGQLNNKLLQCALKDDDFQIILGKTICAWDFYEGQGRLDGAVCEYDEEKKMNFLKKAYDFGVRNLEMEALAFGYLCSQANISSAVVCCTYLDRFKGDQVTASHETLAKWQDRPIRVVVRYMKQYLNIRV